ncbi:hypothetical protein SDC9_187299 [bioreactor metagenome]|uniref:Uncharacterized protein n=1 Tax=bioreactor metagenome TaxID=1076179 RepID=A0A645HNF1_9ZZZZ
MGNTVVFIYIMAVVCGYKRDARFFVNLYKRRVYGFLFLDAMVLKLKEKITPAENAVIFKSNFFGLFVAGVKNCLRNGSRKACA